MPENRHNETAPTPEDHADRTVAYEPNETKNSADTWPVGSQSAVPIPEGGREFGPYRIVEEIGRGGVGVVFRARQERPDRDVALKVLHAGNQAEELDVRRLHAEADAAAALDHPAIVPVFEVGEIDGCHFLAMSFVDGETLGDRLQRGPLTSREAAELLRPIAEGVAFAHAAGIVHRDLKPTNILLDRRGAPRVTDFGLAKRFRADGQLTATGQVMGTPSYMAPEQATGRTGDVGPAADVYALGGILYAMLTGRPPFQAATLTETLIQVAQHEPVPPRFLNPSIDRDLETICLKCLEKSPGRRYGSADEVLAELGRYLEGRPLRARRVGPVGRAVRWCRRNTLAASLVAAVTVSLVLGTAVSTYFAVQAEARSREIERLSRELLSLAVEVRGTEDEVEFESQPVDDGVDRAEPMQGEPEPDVAGAAAQPAAMPPLGDPPAGGSKAMVVEDAESDVRPRSRPVASRMGRAPNASRRGKAEEKRALLRSQYLLQVEELRDLAPNLAAEFDKVVEEPDGEPENVENR